MRDKLYLWAVFQTDPATGEHYLSGYRMPDGRPFAFVSSDRNILDKTIYRLNGKNNPRVVYLEEKECPKKNS